MTSQPPWLAKAFQAPLLSSRNAMRTDGSVDGPGLIPDALLASARPQLVAVGTSLHHVGVDFACAVLPATLRYPRSLFFMAAPSLVTSLSTKLCLLKKSYQNRYPLGYSAAHKKKKKVLEQNSAKKQKGKPLQKHLFPSPQSKLHTHHDLF